MLPLSSGLTGCYFYEHRPIEITQDSTMGEIDSYTRRGPIPPRKFHPLHSYVGRPQVWPDQTSGALNVPCVYSAVKVQVLHDIEYWLCRDEQARLSPYVAFYGAFKPNVAPHVLLDNYTGCYYDITLRCSVRQEFQSSIHQIRRVLQTWTASSYYDYAVITVRMAYQYSIFKVRLPLFRGTFLSPSWGHLKYTMPARICQQIVICRRGYKKPLNPLKIQGFLKGDQPTNRPKNTRNKNPSQHTTNHNISPKSTQNLS